MRRGTVPCPGCGGAGLDVLGDTCTRCDGHGFYPPPCRACGEPTEHQDRVCSALCAAALARRPGPEPHPWETLANAAVAYAWAESAEELARSIDRLRAAAIRFRDERAPRGRPREATA